MSGKLAVAMSNELNETGTNYLARGQTKSNPQSNAIDNLKYEKVVRPMPNWLDRGLWLCPSH